MFHHFLLERFEQFRDRAAVVWRGDEYSYDWLLAAIRARIEQLNASGGAAGRIVSLEGDYSPFTLATLFALFELRSIVVPVDSSLVEAQKIKYLQTAGAGMRIIEGPEGMKILPVAARTGRGTCEDESSAPERSPWIARLQEEKAPGLIIFTSGSTGTSKAAVHHAGMLLEKYRLVGRAKRTIPFMMFDHIGGINTMLQTVSGGGCLLIVADRSPAEICRMIEAYKVEALPVSPTFMNLLLISEAYKDYDLSSLEVVSYGSEVMPQSTLAAWNSQFPHVRAVQAYGMSELGVLHTKSKDSNSLLFALKGAGVEYRIVDGMLEVKAPTAMLGYLNAPHPFTEDGWLRTGDMARTEGEFIQILGRKSDIINVGGEKVFPAEVESVLQLLSNIEEVAVSSAPSGITGQMVKATIRLKQEESLKQLRSRIWEFCKDKLPPYKIPQKIEVTSQSLTSDRLKKIRSVQSAKY
ncbi:fatty acid--CoA ligase family protein [Paenibacillus oenotherae]|uniref:Fatty acid--CoA ligase family protein n=1 Tax=Paenibacillus oenotherae TaxID=1435645 RepID=A0ABS7D004_9BACL|nr:fatty acid--CoA ligase family protein [Paenibacillus oenotherae]MBW7473160.1 fatty acid--CoA ligase family protein [Paenibacillus oenotherae]